MLFKHGIGINSFKISLLAVSASVINFRRTSGGGGGGDGCVSVSEASASVHIDTDGARPSAQS